MIEQDVMSSPSSRYRVSCSFIIQILIRPTRDCLKLLPIIPVWQGYMQCSPHLGIDYTLEIPIFTSSSISEVFRSIYHAVNIICSIPNAVMYTSVIASSH